MRLLLFLLVCPVALSLGIAPASQDIALANTTTGLEFRVYNTENTNAEVPVSVNGTLAQYVKAPGSLALKKGQSITTMAVEIGRPPGGTYSADITLQGRVTARVRATAPSMPTGKVVSSDESSGYFWPMLLVVVIGANLLYLTARKASKQSPAEALLKKVARMDRRKFEKLVTNEQNKLADSIKSTDPELAFRIYDITNRRQMLLEIEDYIKRQPRMKGPDELKKEIRELKEELETFDFSEYEKDL